MSGVWRWVSDQRFGREVGSQPVHPRAPQAILLAAPPERAPPQILDVVQEGRQGRRVGWLGVIAEETATHLSQPSPCAGGALPLSYGSVRAHLTTKSPAFPQLRRCGQRNALPFPPGPDSERAANFPPALGEIWGSTF